MRGSDLVHPTIVKTQGPSQQLVHFAAAGRTEHDCPFARSQTLAEIQADREGSFPGGAFGIGLALDLDVDRFDGDALVRCDRSEG
jgi:hypothetical protein